MWIVTDGGSERMTLFLGGQWLDIAPSFSNGTGLIPTSRLATGLPDGTKYLRDDRVWTVPPAGGGLHASTHQNGGNDEVATATPGANAIPKANVNGKLVNGWLQTGSGNGLDSDTVDGQHASAFESAGAVTAHVALSDPHAQYQKESEKDAANGYAGLSAGSKIASSQISGVMSSSGLTNDSALEKAANKNAASGYAGLDASSKLSGPQQVYGSASNTACQGNDSRLSDARTPTGTAAGDLAGTYPNPTIKSSVSLTTPDVGAATGTSLTVTGLVKSSGTAGMGYATGAGGTVTQLTSKTTGVTINKVCGQITMNGAALAAGAEATFTVTNNTVAATDVPVVAHGSGGTAGAYSVTVAAVAAGSFKIVVSNMSAGSLSEAIVINFAIIKAVSS